MKNIIFYDNKYFNYNILLNEINEINVETIKWKNYKILFILQNINELENIINYKYTNEILFIKREYIIQNMENSNELINIFLSSNIDLNFLLKNILFLKNQESNEINEKYKQFNYFFKISTNNLINKIKIIKDNKHYRLGDVIYHKGGFWKNSTMNLLKDESFNNTILKNYILKCESNNLTKQMNPNFREVLKEIIDIKIEEKKIELPHENELVIHLRMGDVIVVNGFNRKKYENYIHNYIKKHNIKKCTFCIVFQFVERNKWSYTDEKLEKNKIKVQRILSKLINKFNIYFDIKSSNDIDEDFIYMIKSKYFVSDNGGFSRLINDLRL